MKYGLFPLFEHIYVWPLINMLILIEIGLGNVERFFYYFFPLFGKTKIKLNVPIRGLYVPNNDCPI